MNIIKHTTISFIFTVNVAIHQVCLYNRNFYIVFNEVLRKEGKEMSRVITIIILLFTFGFVGFLIAKKKPEEKKTEE